MTDRSMTPDAVPIHRCDGPGDLAVAAEVFDRYRSHYGQPTDLDRTLAWMSEMVDALRLTVFVARPRAGDTTEPVGVATAVTTPASLALGTFWQLRDLYVVPEARRAGIARELVVAVRDAARSAGAIRVSLITEPDNSAALALYRDLGFTVVEGLATLSLGLGRGD